MKYQKHLALFVLLLLGFASQAAYASCYAIPFSVSKNSAKFEGGSTSCPSTANQSWGEICYKRTGSSSGYTMCHSGNHYPYASPGFFQLSLPPYLSPNTNYTYRFRYKKSNGSLGVGMYATFQTAPYGGGGSSSGSSSSSSGGGSGGCPPDIPGCTGG